MNMNILVVDDNHDILRVIKRFLAGQEYEVLAYNSSVKALEDIESNHIDFAILDISMPGVDGLTLGAELRKRSIPFMFLSAFKTEQHEAQSKKAGALELLVKPIRKKQLLLSISNALSLCRRGGDNPLQDPRVNRTINTAVGIVSVMREMMPNEAYQLIRNDARSSGKTILDASQKIIEDHIHFVKFARGVHPDLD